MSNSSLDPMVVYTVVFDDYDFVPVPRPLAELEGIVDFVCFTNRPSIVPRGWNKVLVDTDGASPELQNRRLKILGHPLLDAYRSSLYIDGNIALRRDPRPFLEPYLVQAPIAIPVHPSRDCVYDEAEACIRLGKTDPRRTGSLLSSFGAEGMPRRFGLTHNSFIARLQGDACLHSFMEEWWAALLRGPPRDQLHLQYLVWKHGFELTAIPRADLVWADVFRRLPHKRKSRWHERVALGYLARNYDKPIGRKLEGVLDFLWNRLKKAGSP